MVANPIPFSDIDSLVKLGDALIQKAGAPPTLFCIEWVNAVFSLACCYPLTRQFLTSRGLLSAFSANFPEATLLDDSLTGFTTIPWAGYDPAYIVEAFLETYFEVDLSEAVIKMLPLAALLPKHPVIMPIVPLLEARKKSCPTNFNVKYVCTAVDDKLCIRQ